MKKIPAPILLILATLIWGANFVIGRAVVDDIAPYTLSFLRWLVALICFYPFVHRHLKTDLAIMKKYWLGILLMSLTGVAAFNTLVYVGLHDTTAINASLTYSITPVVIYIFSFIFLKDHLTKPQLIGAIISLGGVSFIISNGSLTTLLQFSLNKGDLLILVSVVCWGFYSILVKHYAPHLPAQTTFFMTIVIGTIMLLPFAIFENINQTMEINWNVITISTILYTGVLASIIAYIFWNTGIAYFNANYAAVFLNFIPVFSTILAVVFLHEQLTIPQAIGGSLVIFGVVLSTKKERQNKHFQINVKQVNL